MWTRDLLKMNAKQVLRNNYWMALLVAFVASLLAGGSSNIGPTLTFNYTTGSDHYNYQYGYDRADALAIVSNRMDQIPSKDSMPGSLYSDLANF